jgi:hypothetical protein
MANTYTWDYPTLDTVPTEDSLTDVIKTIHWRITAVSDSETDDDGNAISASMYGTASAGEVDADNFVAFDSVTKDWCKTKVLDSLGQTEAEVEATLDSKITDLATPPIVSKTPSGWAA